ncbi:hypothetical protein GQ600_3117 [Phytophthora cactorum]|nr:hypothetical protein GQ600_3117 [Phytophthora cactorum]
MVRRRHILLGHGIYGPEFPWGITQTQRCYNLGCFNDKASSVKWEGLPTTARSTVNRVLRFSLARNALETVEIGRRTESSTTRRATTPWILSGRNQRRNFVVHDMGNEQESYEWPRSAMSLGLSKKTLVIFGTTNN